MSVDLNDGLWKELIDSETGLFKKWSEDDRLDIYQTGLSAPLITTLMNGFSVPATWRQNHGFSKSETLFQAIREASSSWTVFYIKHQDEAYAELSWVRKLPEVQQQLLDEFSKNPADEMGSSFLGLFDPQPSDMILFTYFPNDFFRVSLHGRFKNELERFKEYDVSAEHESK